jgi:hypothetical protein
VVGAAEWGGAVAVAVVGERVVVGRR